VLEQYRRKKWGPCKRGVMSLLEIVGRGLMGYMELQQQRMEEELLQMKGCSCEIGCCGSKIVYDVQSDYHWLPYWNRPIRQSKQNPK
jgi:hypothetical protein